ncbi:MULTISPECIES: DUF3397 domain-containing protein [unclassified Paenibacillus]|uniref:DUF3397 domain-containing protein n=1 Tax=unclassified Paenibacillus TaxID=185978 RepID=UPI001C128555|nr:MULTISPECIES: DUF3397 domain-containing protein [unclassified Paenibacillus]MBU5440501.1 DUF3397 domain-containing protein [Paenibacillus sp. MSJ-34]CAH0119576.1 hypothetical protein PAE9249_02080 [Paenibacillus sp. CECT 9249]
MNFITSIFGSMAILPFIPFLAIWLGYGAWSKDRKRAFRLAMDVTTAFLIASVAASYNTIFGGQFGFYFILILLLVAAGLLGGAQNRLRGKIDARKLAKTIWRLTFFVMSVFYVIFLFIGIFHYTFKV